MHTHTQSHSVSNIHVYSIDLTHFPFIIHATLSVPFPMKHADELVCTNIFEWVTNRVPHRRQTTKRKDVNDSHPLVVVVVRLRRFETVHGRLACYRGFKVKIFNQKANTTSHEASWCCLFAWTAWNAGTWQEQFHHATWVTLFYNHFHATTVVENAINCKYIMSPTDRL